MPGSSETGSPEAGHFWLLSSPGSAALKGMQLPRTYNGYLCLKQVITRLPGFFLPGIAVFKCLDVQGRKEQHNLYQVE